ASRKSSCSNETDHWLSSLKECIQLTLDPKGIPANNAAKKVTIVARNFPAEKSGGTYKCVYRKLGSEKINETSAVRSRDNTFTCITPQVGSHTSAVLELVAVLSTGNITLAKADFLFYNCQMYRKCGECVNTVGANCTWNLDSVVCSDQSEYITSKMDCPKLVNNKDVKFIPTSVSSQVTFEAKNILNNTKMWCYVPKNGEDILKSQHAPVDKANGLSCFLN
ncbi:plexin A3-like, partial [Mercenaria mercenaria]|uniref:plexin A3-like n=1 Tax=Mercenaria mercenaria TaxID=6596 RepID=UPI00234F2266